MANTKWSGFLTYRAKHTDIDSVLGARFVPVTYFSVNGGTKRIIDLSTTDDISLVSEFQQARSFKNISLFLPPAKDYEWLQLHEIAHHRLPVTIAFFTSGNIGKTVTHQFTLICKNAEITEQPSQKTDGSIFNTVLKVNMAIPETKLIHGSYQGGDFVEEDW